MQALPIEILFVEHGDIEITDKPHCGDCFNGSGEAQKLKVTDKPHCGDCMM